MWSNDTTIWNPYCVKMLKTLIDGSTFSNFILIEDDENYTGLDLFKSFITNHANSNSFKKINLICCEYPPHYYLPKTPTEKIIPYNYFSDPLNWNDESGPKTDLSAFLSNPFDQETIFFIDSLSCLVKWHEFYKIYKNLSGLKKSAKIIALTHHDLFTLQDIESLETLSSTIIKINECNYSKNVMEKIVTITHKKPNGKVTKQKEVVTVDEDLNVSSKKQVEEKTSKGGSNVAETIQSLATFKLGFDMSESEKKARDELLLPYLRTQGGSGGGEIIYQPDDDEMEDPDDDLEI